MNIYNVLKNDIPRYYTQGFRLSSGNRWLIMDQMNDMDYEFVVYGIENRNKVKEMYRGTNEEDAVEVLIQGCGEEE